MKSALILALLVSSPLLAGAPPPAASHNIHLSTPRGDALRIVVDIPVGEIQITNSTSGDIEVTGTASRQYGKASELAAAQRMADVTGVKIDRVGSRAVIRRQFGPSADNRSGRGSKTRFILAIALPRGIPVEIRQKAGELSLAGSFGDMLLRMRAGNVAVKVPKRSVKEIVAGARIGNLVANLGDRVVTKEGLMAGKIDYLNEGGASLLDVAVSVGDIDIQLTD